jgi:hypothetical protein
MAPMDMAFGIYDEGYKSSSVMLSVDVSHCMLNILMMIHQVFLRWFFDIVFFADIILSFFFENKTSKRNMISSMEVQTEYLKKGFLLDLAITLPYDYIPALDILVKNDLFFLFP